MKDMPERPQPIPEEFGAEPQRPQLKKVYDRDEEEERARLKKATGGLKESVEARRREDEAKRTRQALSGLKEAIKRNEPEAIAARKAADREGGIDLESLTGGITKREEEWFASPPKTEDDFELEIDTSDLDSDTEEEKKAYTPQEREWFKEGERGNAGDVAIPTKEYDETIVKALQDAAERLSDTEGILKMRYLKDIHFDFQPKGWWGQRRLRKAREKFPDQFSRYDQEKKEYDQLLEQADRYGVFSGKVGTPRLGLMEKAKQRLETGKVLGKE